MLLSTEIIIEEATILWRNWH